MRIERSRVESDGDADRRPSRSSAKLGSAVSRRSASALGGVWELRAAWGGGWQAYGNVARTERAPTTTSCSPTVCTSPPARIERGDPSLSKEKGVNLDVALEWRSGANRLRAGVFASRFSNYIALLATGEPDFVDDAGDAFPIYAFEGVERS